MGASRSFGPIPPTRFSFSSAPGRIFNQLSAATVREALDPFVDFGNQVEQLGDLASALPGIGENTPFTATAIFDGSSSSVVDVKTASTSDNTISAIAERDAISFDAANISGDVITLGAHALSVGQRVRFEEDASGTVAELSSGTEYFIREADKTTVKLASTVDGTAIAIAAPSGSGHQLVPVHRFVSGQELTYVADSPDSIGGLTSGDRYFVVNAIGDEFQLALTRGGTPLEVTPAASGTTHRLRVVPIAGGDVTVGKAAGIGDLFGRLRDYFVESYIETAITPTLAGLG